MSLFRWDEAGIPLHAGDISNFFIDCDALSDEDLQGLARLATTKLAPWHSVFPIPTGGTRFAQALAPLATSTNAGDWLIVDDVFTTGMSLRQEAKRLQREAAMLRMEVNISAVVIFARDPVHAWVTPLFQMRVGKLL